MPRSGTNFLSNLLQLHPECGPADPVWEDFLVSHLDQLAAYSDSVAGEWDAAWGVNNQTATDLDIALGNGLADFLEDRCPGTRVVSKTPRVDNLGLFFRFFPRGKLLILVRDGRSIVESAARSFDWNREAAMHSVSQAAKTIARFQEIHASENDHFRILRYEDLWQDTETQLHGLFKFLELDPGNYDWQQALALPVRGSSELKTAQENTIHWDPIERNPEFDPMSRFADWSDALHFRYNHVVGADMAPFGYRNKSVAGPAILLRLRNVLLDVTWGLKVLLRPLYHRLRRR